jgi:pyruvate formate lyase activating enzyme
MNIVLRKTSLVDYPGKVSSVLFFKGCNLRCPWCHNRELVLSDSGDSDTADNDGSISLERAMKHLEKRRAVLSGVVLSGGEPTLYPQLPELMRRIKGLGYKVKLDTNGMLPNMLSLILQEEATSPDYIALDLKVSPDRYAMLSLNAQCSDNTSGDALIRSAEIVRNSGVACEFRTIALPCITEKDIEALAPLAGDSLWHIRAFIPGNCLDPLWDDYPPSDMEFIERLAKKRYT